MQSHVLESVAPESEDARPQVFLSYGRADAAAIADVIEHGLAGEFRIWRDRSVLLGGHDWQKAIQTAIDQSVAVIAVLTPHAVREDSVCLNELQHALHRRKPIVPVVTEGFDVATLPLQLNRTNFVEFRKRPDRSGELTVLAELRRALSRLDAPRTGPWWALEPTLRPAFDGFLEERHSAFSGREWVFSEIDEWRGSRPEPCMLIVGEPGIGKSTIVADLVQRNPEGQVLAYHCCRRDDVMTLRPGRFVHSLAVMLAQRVEAYGERIAEPDMRALLGEGNCNEAPVYALEVGVLQPLREIDPPAQGGAAYLLVDGLDEAALYHDTTSQQNIVQLLELGLARFPDWLRLLATTRPRVAAGRLRDAHVCRLRARSSGNIRDIRRYLQTRLRSLDPAAATKIQRTLMQLSGGNFLYLKLTTDAILTGYITGDDLRHLPYGVAELYAADFRHRFGDASSTAYERTAALLAVMLAARQPLTTSLLAEALEVTTAELQTRLAALSSYIPQRGETWSFFHKSFADWLRDETNAFRVDVQQGHSRLARVAISTLRDLEWDPDISAASIAADPQRTYVGRYGVYHLVRTRNFGEAIDLIHLIARMPAQADASPDEEAAVDKATLDGLVRHVMIALRRPTRENCERIDPDKLAPLLRDCYEIEPLSGPLDMMVRFHRANLWDNLDELLATDNFVLRYALAEALAKASRVSAPTVTLADLTQLLTSSTLNRRELGGYALRRLYTQDPGKIDPQLLEIMAESETYPGRSILGDLLLNLMFLDRYRRDMVQSDRFSRPVWDFHKLDVWDLDAAAAFKTGEALPADAEPGVVEALMALRETDDQRRALLANTADQNVRTHLLDAYFKLGRNVDLLGEYRVALQRLPHFTELIRLFFAHPLWAVAEAAASVLASIIIEDDPGKRPIITQLFDDPSWRVRFGAIEAAFQIRHLDQGEAFGRAVHRFYGDTNCRVRALCAENLVSMIVNRGALAADRLLAEFDAEIRVWLRDEDCWVLEHVFRLVRALAARGRDLTGLLSDGVSRLFADQPLWYQLDREAFLIHIESRKRVMIGAGA